MTVLTETRAGATVIRPFRFEATQAEPEELRARGAWPDEQVESFRAWIADGALA